MKQIGAFRKFVYSGSEYIYGLCTFLIAALQYVKDIETIKPEGWPLAGRPRLTGMVQILQEQVFFLSILVALVAFVCFCLKRGADPWVLEKVKFILDGYRIKCFDKVRGDPDDHHRITLFKCERSFLTFHRHWSSKHWYSPSGVKPMFSGFLTRSRYLIPILRSGHISQKTSVLFYICDDSDKVEGIAGLAWATRQPIVRDNLPDLLSVRNKESKKYKELLEEYSAQTVCSVEFVQGYIDRKKPLPRSIAAIPVMVRDDVWGVVVLDSRKPDGVSNESVGNYELTVAVIGQLLEKA